MRRKFGRAAAAAAVLALALSVGTASALAPEGDGSACGYLAGRQQSRDRHAQFEQAAGLTTDAEREAFFQSAGTGKGGAYEKAQHLDADALAAAGVISQDTADRIADYSAQKQTGLHDWYGAKDPGLTPQERRTYFACRQEDGFCGDSLEELLEAGIITPAEAEAISSYLSE